MEQFERLAFGLEALTEEPAAGRSQATAPVVPSLWSRPVAARLLTADSAELVSLDPALLTVAGRRRPVWLGTRLLPGGRLVVDRPGGRPHRADRRGAVLSPAGLGPVAIGSAAARPRDRARFTPQAPQLPARAGRGRGRRARLLAPAGDARVGAAGAGAARRRSSRMPGWIGTSRRPGRLGRLAPFAAVGRALGAGRGWRAALDRRRLPAGRRPSRCSPSIDWRGRRVAGFRAGLLGTVTRADRRDAHLPAARRATRSRRPGPRIAARRRGAERRDPRGCLAGGAVSGGALSGAGAPAGALEPQARDARCPDRCRGVWSSRARRPPGPTTRPGRCSRSRSSAPGERRLSALLTGSHGEDNDALRLTRFDSATALPVPERAREPLGAVSRPTTR